MNVSDVLKRCNHLKVEEKNDISQDFVERVFLKGDIEQWEAILTNILGPPVKQLGEKTTQFFSDLTINYGGLQDDQILFYQKCEENSMIAMLWPWKDNNQVTLKIACFKE